MLPHHRQSENNCFGDGRDTQLASFQHDDTQRLILTGLFFDGSQIPFLRPVRLQQLLFPSLVDDGKFVDVRLKVHVFPFLNLYLTVRVWLLTCSRTYLMVPPPYGYALCENQRVMPNSLCSLSENVSRSGRSTLVRRPKQMERSMTAGGGHPTTMTTPS